MRAYEFIGEGTVPSKVIYDNIGGMIKITPDPDLSTIGEKFSMSYINDEMSKYYRVNSRILGLDSHGHIGKPEPHLHLMQRSKNKGYVQIEVEKLNFKIARHIFYGLLLSIKQKYIKDKNESI